MYFGEMDSPIGRLRLLATDSHVRRILFPREAQDFVPGRDWKSGGVVIEGLTDQLENYFAGRRKTFDLPLEPQGTDFQRTVWQALLTIPYGETISYGELAALIGRPMASRAVGAANGQNPIPIIIPCHRVIGSDGSLTGYGGGLDIKQILLELEGWRQPTQMTLV